MPENVKLNDANFSLGPDSGFFYSCSFSLQALIKVQGDGTFVESRPVARSTFRTSVKELHFDGTFFWTLEDLPSNLGIVIKRWRLSPFPTAAFPSVTPFELRWQDELTLLNQPSIRWSADAFAIEHYHRVLEGDSSRRTVGVSVIRLDDVSNISAGDILYLGPSTFGGFVGNEEEITVTSVNTTTKDITFFKGGGLENSYISLDPVNFHKSIYIFNKHSFGGSENGRGALVNYAYPEKQQNFSDIGGRYGKATAADFTETTLSWVIGYQIFDLDITNPTFDVSASQEANLVEDDFSTLIEVFDLISDFDNSQYLKLQNKETTENLGTGSLSTVTFPNGLFNFQAQPRPAFVNSVNMEFQTNRFLLPSPSAESIDITVRVRDQFNFPVFNKTVNFSAAINTLSDPGIAGSLTPATIITNSSGIGETVYTPSSTTNDIIVDITADVV